ncbi:MAG: TOMM precursor leader peptide-binding protein [Oligoflexales bacterium]
MRYCLAPYSQAGFEEKTLCFGFGSIQQKIPCQRFQRTLLEVAAYWKTPRTEDEVLSKFSQRHQIEEVVDFLFEGNFLMRAGIFQSDERFSRHALFYNLSGADPREVQKSLATKHVVVVGCGGIGNMISGSLATLGVGKITLIDRDYIEPSNLSRQLLFTEDDVGESKVEVLARALRARDASAHIETLEMCLNHPADLENIPPCDLIVLSADKPARLPLWMNDFAVQTRTAMINVGYVQDIAVWGPFVIPGKTGCWRCQALTATAESEDKRMTTLLHDINSGYQAPSIGPVNMMAASHALIDILKYLGGFGQITSLNKRLGIWTHDLRFDSQPCQLNPSCSVCGHLQSKWIERTAMS